MDSDAVARKRMAVSVGDTAIRIALIGDSGRFEQDVSWQITDFTTLTDALMKYEKTSGTALTDVDAAISIIGATYGETISIVRGRWMISRSGLLSLFRRNPRLVNDVAATAWAAIGGEGIKIDALSRGHQRADMSRRGRWLVSNIDSGVGLASIDVNEDGEVRVLECEMGHCEMAPVDAMEHALYDALAPRHRGMVTWEVALTLTNDDPIWNTAGLPAVRSERIALLARIAGRFASDAILAHGAWGGIFLAGRLTAEFAAGKPLDAFNAGFEAKPKFQRFIQAAPRWRITGHDLTMAGLAVASSRSERSKPAAAIAEAPAPSFSDRPAFMPIR